MKDKIKLYELVESIGEILEGDLHILDVSPEYKQDEAEGKFKVYHRSGYCIDVEKEQICEPSEVSQYDGDVHTDGFMYTYFAEWEGFKKIKSAADAIRLIKKWAPK